jgi:hypothetical protein
VRRPLLFCRAPAALPPALPAGVILLAGLALLAAGCGARTSKPFTAKGTVPCLKSKGFTDVSTAADRVGFIASFAANGGLRATSPGNNAVTIAFTADPDEVDSTEQAFRRVAPPLIKPHLADILRSNRNAVILWTTAPSDEDTSALNGCLSP